MDAKDIFTSLILAGSGIGLLRLLFIGETRFLVEEGTEPEEDPCTTEPETEHEPTEKSTLMVDSPARFDTFVGQSNAVTLMKMHVDAARMSNKPVPHTMFEGPGGTGKTTLATCVANEIGTNVYFTTPSTFKDKSAVLNFFFTPDGECKINRGDVLFIDEIHRVREAAAIYLYSAMQDFYIDVGGSIAELPEFTLIGATTDLGMLPGPFRDRFKVKITLNRYLTPELSRIVVQFKSLPKSVADEIAKRGGGIPRIAKSISDNVIAYSKVNGDNTPTIEDLEEVCKLLEIDDLGLNKTCRRVIEYLKSTDNKPIGAASLAGALNISRDTLESEVYPLLFAQGILMSQGTRGKNLTEKGTAYTT